MDNGEAFWWYITIKAPESQEDLLYSIADATGSIGAELRELPEGLILKAYYRASKDLESWVSRVNEAISKEPNMAIVDMGKVENRQWHVAWRDAFPPLIVGERFVVMAPWHKGNEPAGHIPIYIYPGSAFGTGYHESTQIALSLLSRHCRPGMTAIDVGSGSGILSIACWRLGARKVYARDVDPATLEEARRNFELNGVEEGAIELSSGDGLTGLPVAVDLIVANILLEELLRLIPDIRAHLKDGGVAIFSGLILKERESFLDALQRAGFYALDELEKEEWWGVAATRSA